MSVTERSAAKTAAYGEPRFSRRSSSRARICAVSAMSGAGFVERKGRGVFEEGRQIIRQFPRGEMQPGFRVERGEIDHRLPTVAPLAMDMLEEMQGEAPRLVEKVDIALLELEQVERREIGEKRRERLGDPGVDQPFREDDAFDLVFGGDELDRGVGQERRERLQRSSHHTTSIGVLGFLAFLAPKRSGSDVPPSSHCRRRNRRSRADPARPRPIRDERSE